MLKPDGTPMDPQNPSLPQKIKTALSKQLEKIINYAKSGKPGTLSQLLIYYGPAAFDKQKMLERRMNASGNPAGHRVSYEAQKLIIDGIGEFAIQFIGKCDNSTWQWAWSFENDQRYPLSFVQFSRTIKETGMISGIEDFTNPVIQLYNEKGETKIQKSMIGLISVGICGASAYYSFKDGETTDYFLIADRVLPEDTTIDMADRVYDYFREFISKYYVGDHYLALLNYANYLKLEVVERGGFSILRHNNASIVKAEFSLENKLIHIEKM